MKNFQCRKKVLATSFHITWGALSLLPMPAWAGEMAALQEQTLSSLLKPQAVTRLFSNKPDNETAQNSAGSAASLTESDRLAAEAISLVRDNKLKQASEKINAALRMRVDRSYYHLINGLIYHLQARQGENAAYDLAEQGYQQAIHFDQTNWQAYLFSGMLFVDTSRFDKARQQLAEALYYRPEDPGLLNAFAYAAYRSGKPDQAAGAINALEAHGGPQSANEWRNAALIMAAVGEPDKAKVYLERLKGQGNDALSSLVERRVDDWDGVYKRAALVKTNYGDPMAGGGVAPGAYGATGGGMPGFAAPGMPPPFAPPPPSTDNKMIVVDVVLISTEENFSTSKGLNLMRGLQLQFGVNGGPGYSKIFTGTNETKFSGEDGTNNSSASTTVTRSLSIPGITYSLNIFNSNEQRDQILARPTLVATSGRVSEFFSGVEINAVVVNSSNNTSASPVNIQKEVGVSLAVAPTINPDNTIGLKVKAERTFIRTPNKNLVGFDARVETTKSKVDASVVLRYGETLILGGLSEKEAENTRDGVPLLQDIPLVQYLFSNKSTLDYQKSTLILVTPRPAQYVYQPENARQEYEKSLSEDERPLASLRARYADWFKPYPNWASVFHHLQENSLYREFRTGDVALESWTDLRTLQDRLDKMTDFLYY